MTNNSFPRAVIPGFLATFCFWTGPVYSVSRLEYINILLGLIGTMGFKDKTKEAEYTGAHAVKSYPPCGATFSNHAGTMAASKKHMEEGLLTRIMLKLDSKGMIANYNAAFYYLGALDIARGWRQYSYRLQKEEFQKDFPFPRWQGEPLAGKKILIVKEQGLGDVAMFGQYLQDLKSTGAFITFYTYPALAGLFGRCDYVDRLVTTEAEIGKQDYWAYVGSLPYELKIGFDKMIGRGAYLHAQRGIISYWKKVLEGNKNFKIGICWQGTNAHKSPGIAKVAAARSVPLVDLLRALLSVPNVSVYSLQKNLGLGQIGKLPPELKKNFIDLTAILDGVNGSFEDTAALMGLMDIVITIDTSTVHVAGALGAKTWVLLPQTSDWRWFKAPFDKSPFYPDVELFRLPRGENWNESVLPRVTARLRDKVRKKERRDKCPAPAA